MRPDPRPAIGPRIDLHTHSSCSDGTQTVGELARAAAAAGLDTFALTDHDTTMGWASASDAARESGVAIVPGIEVSSVADRRSVHILALLPDVSAGSALVRLIDRARESRLSRARRMVDALAVDFPLTWDDVLAQVADPTTSVGRPHIADALVAAGLASDRGDAFARMLSPDAPYYQGYWAPEPAEAVEAIRAAGGVAILAHPGSSTRGRRGGTGAVPIAGDAGVDRAVVDAMVDAGLMAIEVDHREHSEQERSVLREYAASRRLLVTGGSDYHGAGKPNRLGENLTSPDVLEALIAVSSSKTEVLRP